MKESGDFQHIIRFAVPVAIENLVTQIISMLIPALIGGISGSALAAVGMANQTVSMFVSIFALMSTGGAVLLARSIGAGNRQESSLIAEQNLLLTVLVSLLLAAASFAAAAPIMRLLMPTAEADMFREAVIYFRYMMVSFPAYMLYSVVAAMLRAAGNSRGPLLATAVLNIVQVAASALFIRGMNMGIEGAGAACIAARLMGGGILVAMLFKFRGSFHIRIKQIFRPHFPTWKRMVRVGAPNTLDSTLVQAGYLISNSMIVGLGTHEATVYQVVNTLYNFAAYPQGITGPVLISFVGQLLGAGNIPKAKKTLWGIFMTGLTAEILWSLIITLNVSPLSRLYTSDAAVLAESRIVIWYMFAMCIPAMAINGMDPGLRTGGDSKCIMVYTILGVWAVRVPLTWLFCYYWDWGVAGLFLANICGLIFRALCSQVRFHTGKWLHKTV